MRLWSAIRRRSVSSEREPHERLHHVLVGVAEQALDLVAHELAHAAGGLGHDRQPGAAGLEGGDAEGLEVGGGDEHVGAAEHLAHAVAVQPAGEGDRPGHRVPAQEGPHASQQRPVTGHEQMHRGAGAQLLLRLPDHLQQGERALAQAEPHHGRDDQLAVGCGGGRARATGAGRCRWG